MTSPYTPKSSPCFSCAIGCALTSPWPSKPALTQCLLKYSHFSLTLVSLFSSSWERSHHWEPGRTGRNHVEVLLCWEVLMDVVRQFLTSSSLSEVARPGRQPVAGSLCSLCLFPLLVSWKLLTFQATNGHNTSWSFWGLHVINPKITAQPQAIMQSSRYWKLSLFNENKKVQRSLIMFHIKPRFSKISDH